MGSSLKGSMKNLSPAAYEVATTPSCILMVKCCADTQNGSSHSGCIKQGPIDICEKNSDWERVDMRITHADG